jgi:hypothetical protein
MPPSWQRGCLLFFPPDPSRRKEGIADKRKRWALQPALDPSLKLPSGQRAAVMGTACDSRPLRAQLSPETGFVSGHPLAKFWKKQPGECSRPLRWPKHHGSNR